MHWYKKNPMEYSNKCYDCGKPLPEGSTGYGHKKNLVDTEKWTNKGSWVFICPDCYVKRQKLESKRKRVAEDVERLKALKEEAKMGDEKYTEHIDTYFDESDVIKAAMEKHVEDNADLIDKIKVAGEPEPAPMPKKPEPEPGTWAYAQKHAEWRI